MSDLSDYISGFCRVDNCGSCRQHFHKYGLTEARDCACSCHRLDGLLRRMGVKKAVAVLEECVRCQ